MNGEERMSRHLRNTFNTKDLKTIEKKELAGNRRKNHWQKDEEVLLWLFLFSL